MISHAPYATPACRLSAASTHQWKKNAWTCCCAAISLSSCAPPAASKVSGRLLLLSPFKQKDRRPTAKLAEERNRFVPALATEVFVAYAAEGGKTEQLCRDLIAARKPVFTFVAPSHARLIEIGCTSITTSDLIKRWTKQGPATITAI